jgi:hypothetical protein
MQRTFFLLLYSAIFCISAEAQTDTSKWLRAFPVTDYMVSLNDSVKVVQLEMPDGITIAEKQLGLMYGRYNGVREEAVEKGYGRCYLIKSNYFYFAMGHNQSGLPLKAGDLIYTNMPVSAIYYGRIPKLAGHFIKLLNVYDSALYDRYLVFNQWSPVDEKNMTDTLVSDIQFTGNYFLQNNPEMNQDIKTGTYAGNKVLQVMTSCTAQDVEDFLDYIIARPRLYAGREWKIAEIFATWLVSGAPKPVK